MTDEGLHRPLGQGTEIWQGDEYLAAAHRGSDKRPGGLVQAFPFGGVLASPDTAAPISACCPSVVILAMWL